MTGPLKAVRVGVVLAILSTALTLGLLAAAASRRLKINLAVLGVAVSTAFSGVCVCVCVCVHGTVADRRIPPFPRLNSCGSGAETLVFGVGVSSCVRLWPLLLQRSWCSWPPVCTQVRWTWWGPAPASRALQLCCFGSGGGRCRRCCFFQRMRVEGGCGRAGLACHAPICADHGLSVSCTPLFPVLPRHNGPGYGLAVSSGVFLAITLLIIGVAKARNAGGFNDDGYATF